MTAQKEIVERIVKAMAEGDWTQQRLADAVGMSKTQMSRTMSGERKLTAGELGAIAEALGVAASSLLGQAEAMRPLAVAARLGQTAHASVLDGPFARAQQLLEVRDLLDRLLTRPAGSDRPRVTVPTTTFRKKAGERLARAVRAALGLGAEPIDDLDELAERFGMDVSVQPLPDGLHGLLVTDATVPGAEPAAAVALVNSADNYGRRRFTIAHELGHLLFGDAKDLFIADFAVGDDGPNLPELCANAFAAHLLAPDEAVQRIAESRSSEMDDRLAWASCLVVDLALIYGVSVESALIRARDVDVITAQEKERLAASGAHALLARAGRSGDWAKLDGDAGRVQPPAGLLAQALTAYRDGMLGLRPLATLYDTDDQAALEMELRAAGWAPEFTTI